MMRHRLRRCAGEERGFTLIELLVVMILIGILAAIALAVLLNQANKGDDVNAKSDVTNVARIIQVCNAGRDTQEDFRNCDSSTKLSSNAPPVEATPADEIASGECAGPSPTDNAASPDAVRILRAGKDCFVVIGKSKSGNRFWYIKHNDGSVSHDCDTRGSSGCPSDGEWAG